MLGSDGTRRYRSAIDLPDQPSYSTLCIKIYCTQDSLRNPRAVLTTLRNLNLSFLDYNQLHILIQWKYRTESFTGTWYLMYGAHMCACVCVDGGPSTRRGSKLNFLATLPEHTEICKPHHPFGSQQRGHVGRSSLFSILGVNGAIAILEYQV